MNDLKVLLLDVVELGSWFEARCEEMLLPPPTGLYLPTSTHPKLVPSETYYDLGGQPIAQPGFQAVDHYDEYGTRVLQAAQTRHLRATPYLPVRGIDLIVSIAERHVSESRRYLNSQNNSHPITVYGYDFDKWLKAEYRYEYVVENQDGIKGHYQDPQHNFEVYKYLQQVVLERYIRQLSNFINDDGWMIYDVQLIGTTLQITKTIDYRIDFYNRMNAPGQTTLAIGGDGSEELKEKIITKAQQLMVQLDPEIQVTTMVCGKS